MPKIENESVNIENSHNNSDIIDLDKTYDNLDLDFNELDENSQSDDINKINQNDNTGNNFLFENFNLNSSFVVHNNSNNLAISSQFPSNDVNNDILSQNITSSQLISNNVNNDTLSQNVISSGIISNNVNKFSYFNSLKKFIFSCKKNFSILHLNINSLLLKIDEFDSILSLGYDILTLNETKLDSAIPHSFYKNSNYNQIRLDRTRRGGGIIVFIRREYKYTSSIILNSIEAIVFNITFNKNKCTFISTYKPPLDDDLEYLNDLENLVYNNDINSNNHLFIIGDLNMDLKSKKGTHLKNFMANNNLINYVKTFTRIDKRFIKKKDNYVTPKTLIDVILHNNKQIIKTESSNCPFSDHNFVLAELKFSQVSRSKKMISSRNLCEKNLLDISTKLDNTVNYILPNDSVDNNWLNLKIIINDTVNQIAPQKNIPSSYKTKFPWSDKTLHLIKKERDLAYRNYRLHLDNELHLNYKYLRSLYQSEKRKKMIIFYKSKSNINDFKDSKAYWKFYSASIKLKSDKSSEPIVLKNNDKLITDHKDVANYFNTFFTSLTAESSVNLNNCLDQVDKNFTELKSNGSLITGNFNFNTVTESTVQKLLAKLNNESSAGSSGIPVKVIKNSESLIKPITLIINDCILNCNIPEEWKSAVVTPLYKSKGDKNEINNYRGISVISPVAKIFEKVLATQIIKYLDDYKILCDDQHGFRNSHSCETALHKIISDLNSARNKKLVSLLLFIDFRKAFDLVDSNILLCKLKHLGFDNNACKLIKNYFSLRTQAVKYENEISELKSVELGCGQGTVLGALFFSIFINDMPLLLNLFRKVLFADDTTLYLSRKNVTDLITSFKNTLLPLLDWCKFNRMDINWSKTFFMFIKNKKYNYPVNIDIMNYSIEVVDSFKLLGVTLDSKLNFSEFISCTKKLINARLYSIKRLFYLSFNVKIQFFKTFIMPYFNYCITLSIYFPKSTLQSFCNFYYFCLYKLFKLKTNGNLTDVNNILESMSLSSFQHNLLTRLAIFAYNIYNDVNAPTNLKQLLLNKKNITYNLRSNSILFKSCIPLNHYGESTFDFFFPKFVNTICLNDISLNNNFFKSRLNNNVNLLNVLFIKEFPKFDLYIKIFEFMNNSNNNN